MKQKQLCLMSYNYVMCGIGGHVALGTHFEYRLRFLLLSIIVCFVRTFLKVLTSNK